MNRFAKTLISELKMHTIDNRIAFQLAADAVYGASAETNHVPPTEYTDAAIARAPTARSRMLGDRSRQDSE